MKVFLLFVLLLVLVGCGKIDAQAPKFTQESAFVPSTPTPAEEDSHASPQPANPLEIVIKVRVYQLSFEGAPAYNSTFSESKIATYVDEVNKIYEQAGVRLELESIQPLTIPKTQIASFSSNETNQTFVSKMLKIVFPKPSSNDPLFQAAFFHHFPVSAKGLYIKAHKVAFIGEYGPNGSINEPIVTAHEMGHELSLDHSNESGTECSNENLMCTGGTGIGLKLTDEQINDMRDQAKIGPAI